MSSDIVTILVAAFLFACCLVPGFGRRLFKWIAVVVICAALGYGGYSGWQNVMHPAGSDEDHPIWLSFAQLGTPPERKF
jgi:hypothetical protein